MAWSGWWPCGRSPASSCLLLSHPWASHAPLRGSWIETDQVVSRVCSVPHTAVNHPLPVYVCTCVYMNVCTCTCVHMCVHICVYTNMCVCVRVPCASMCMWLVFSSGPGVGSDSLAISLDADFRGNLTLLCPPPPPPGAGAASLLYCLVPHRPSL